jgi:two-component system, LuxR family, sensor kinase FixL
MIAYCLQAGRTKVLSVAACLVVLIVLADRAVGNSVSLGVLYIFPIVLAAVVLAPLETAALSVFCSLLRAWFDTPGSRAEVVLRFIFATLGYFASGLFVTALVRNRELVVQHLNTVQQEQQLRRSAEEQLKLLVESSPAAILTIDGAGVVLAANFAANAMFDPHENRSLQGQNIGGYLPVLSDAVRFQIGPETFRTAAQCQGRRENGDIFLAHTWFSSYLAPEGTRLAAIVVDSSEEMRAREEQNLQQLEEYNRIAAAALSHEVRNVCAAINLLSLNLREKYRLDPDADYQGLTNLIGGLEKVAALDLHSRGSRALEEISLQTVLDNLRIIIEPEWREMGGIIRWPRLQSPPNVCADAHGLLQVFLNLVRNSYRAIQDSMVKELAIHILVKSGQAAVQLHDSGPGIPNPEHLFQPFRHGAEGSGLGLYISRAMVRSYGGDLRFEPSAAGACFTIELQVV